MRSAPPPLWRDLLAVVALGAALSVVLFALYLGTAILRSSW